MLPSFFINPQITVLNKLKMKSQDQDHFLVVQEDITSQKVWRQKKSNGVVKETPLDSMSESQLQQAYNKSCSKQLYYHNKTMIFDELVTNIEEVAESKGFELKDYDSNFHSNRREHKNRLKKRENVQ